MNLTFLRLGLAPSTVARKRTQNRQISKPMRTENIAVTRILSVPKTYAVCLCAPTLLPPALSPLSHSSTGSVYLFSFTPFLFFKEDGEEVFVDVPTCERGGARRAANILVGALSGAAAGWW
jgi:hypothetical protein